MDKDVEMLDPYERDQQRMLQLFDEVPTDEEIDPYDDSTGEYGSDENYEQPSSESDEVLSSDDTDVPTVSRKKRSALKNKKSSIPEEPNRQNTEHLLDDISPETSPLPSPRPSSTEPFDSDLWETTLAPIPDFNFDESSNRLKIDIGPDSEVMEVFESLFTPHILDYLVECTNNYGLALMNTNRPKTRNSRITSFRPVSNEEMKKFLGLCMLQGQVATKNMRRYFSYSDTLYFHPVFSYTMSSRRFEQILRVLCCSPVNSQGKSKIEPIINMLITQFQSAYGPSKELSLDESLLHFRGRLRFRVYIKNKKSRYGLKFFELTTSDGYLLNMELYSGPVQENDESDNTKTEAVVMRLMKPYLMKGHELFMDNYYNSYELSEKLLSFKTHTNGTLRSNRKSNPRNLVKRKLKRGQHFWVRRKQVYVSKWKDKRDVLVITTRNHPQMVSVKNRFGKEQIKPIEVSTYNDHMSGIDRCDQMTSTYSTPRKTIRWYKKCFFHLLDIAVWNAFYLTRKFCKNNSRKYRFLHFRDELIKHLIQLPADIEAKHLIRRQKHDNRRPEQASYETEHVIPGPSSEGHWPERNPGEPTAKSNKKSVFLKCRLCTTKKIRKETSYRCKGCVEKPPLCPDCFQEWHEKNPK